MSHLDPERMALLAIGENAEDGERSHLDDCPQCAAELDELAFAVSVGRSTVDVGEWETPPERVWEGILADISAPRADPPAEPPAASGAASAPAASAPAPPATPPAAPSSPAAGAGSPPPRGRTRMLFTLAASVALLLVIVGIGVAVRPSQPVEVAAASLDAFPAHPGARGSATVIETDDRERVVRVTLDADADTGEGSREVWLITADATALVSLGTLEGSEGTFPIPPDIDIDEYVLLDVSLEPEDGDPQHSGDSIVRGELRAA
ncbi:anti-sigma factor [Microbacterium wangchenii]|uniref:anti-sigma factor n=1 Tax=Microbacterium wangchenii TaxID=2541726 RepID=UPI0011C7A5F0|nr:anti-sigma factor [Microbacterium wangchenii]TXK16868.1 anti-sigma factor [Microbacterium wangchenii]